MSRLLRNVSRIALSRGLGGGSRVWVTIGAVAGGLRLLGKWIGDEPQVVYSEDLEPGRSLIIRHFPRVTK
ncbi:MAG: hypothetical protein M3179_03895 [Actinomycetota bacterium]|nr:hypothetical protein [Actinomycetota bacterium]